MFLVPSNACKVFSKFWRSASWNPVHQLGLPKVAFSIRHAEYNPRKHTSITVPGLWQWGTFLGDHTTI